MKPTKFKLEIDLTNDAFQPDASPEIARILKRIVSELETWGDIALPMGYIRDDNGNRVGCFGVLD